MKGYIGKILRVDLGKSRLWDEPIKEEHARLFVGGSGLGARIIYDMVDANTDPLGPENPLVFMTGPPLWAHICLRLVATAFAPFHP
jgi:aldehyde:ferredoxin oxidoreductase